MKRAFVHFNSYKNIKIESLSNNRLERETQLAVEYWIFKNKLLEIFDKARLIGLVRLISGCYI